MSFKWKLTEVLVMLVKFSYGHHKAEIYCSHQFAKPLKSRPSNCNILKNETVLQLDISPSTCIVILYDPVDRLIMHTILTAVNVQMVFMVLFHRMLLTNKLVTKFMLCISFRR